MEIKNLLSIIISVITTASTTVLTPSGVEVPASLLTYLDCPIGDVQCKNGKGSTCTARSNSCRYGNPAILGELLHNEGYDIGNLTSKEFCDIYLEVCDMIMKYDPPLTDDYIYNYKRYFTCHIEDSKCIYGQTTSCQTVVKKCWDTYPTQACKQLSIVCDSINTGVIPSFDSSTQQLKTFSGEVIPASLLTYLECPIGDVICKNGKGSTCTARSNVCRGSSPETLAEGLANNGYDDIGGLSPKTFCKIHLEVCDMIMDYNPPLNDDDIYNLDKYLTCDMDDLACQYGKRSNCKAVLELCWKNYSIEVCQALSNTCDKINGSDRRSDRRNSTTTIKSTTKKYSNKYSTTKRNATKSTIPQKTTTKRNTTKSTIPQKTITKKSTTKSIIFPKTISKKSSPKTKTTFQKSPPKTRSTTKKATVYRKTNTTKATPKKSTPRQNAKKKSKTNKKIFSTQSNTYRESIGKNTTKKTSRKNTTKKTTG